MPFDIRDYNGTPEPKNKQEEFWTVRYLRHVDEFFPRINSECEYLIKYSKPDSADAFSNKVNAWKEFVMATQKLCMLYKIKDAKCLSRKN